MKPFLLTPNGVPLATREMVSKIFVVWLMVKMLTAARLIVLVYLGDGSGDIWCPLIVNLADALIWTGGTYGLFWLSDRLPLERMTWMSMLLIVPAVIIVAILRMVVVTLVTEYALAARMTLLEMLQFYLLSSADRVVTEAVLVLWLGHALRIHRLRQQATLRASELAKRLAVAQLDHLRTQLQPHFLFNTLNSIASLVGDDTQGARRMIARLSELLRLSLGTMQERLIPLTQELEIVSRYIEIQKVRFAELLDTQLDVDDDCLDALLPPFLLQPLVENAIKHGLTQSNEACRMRIRASRAGGQLHITLENDCAAMTRPIIERVGVSNTRERLRVVYGEHARFELEQQEGMVTVRIALPFELGNTTFAAAQPLEELVLA